MTNREFGESLSIKAEVQLVRANRPGMHGLMNTHVQFMEPYVGLARTRVTREAGELLCRRKFPVVPLKTLNEEDINCQQCRLRVQGLRNAATLAPLERSRKR